MGRDFPMQAIGKPARLTLAALVLGLLATLGVVLIVGGPELTLVNRALVALALLASAAVLLLGARRMRVTLEDGRLVVRAAFYTQRVAVEELDVGAARIIDLAEHPEWRPTLRLNGMSLPGLDAGYYRARHLKQRLFCALTSRRNVLLLPRHNGRALLLSPESPQALLRALQQAARRS